jgi:hypothetical protein
MELSLQEQQLLADFRQLSSGHKDDLLLHLAALRRKTDGDVIGVAIPSNQCAMKKPEEKQPESDSDQLITE